VSDVSVSSEESAASPPSAEVAARPPWQRHLEPARARLSRYTVWQALFVAMVMIYVVYFTRVTLDVHHGLGTSSYDVGLYQQGVWLLSQGKAPFVTLMGRNMLGDHASLILLFVAPIYRLFPAAGTLYFIQSLVIGLGALPVFLAARKRLQSEATALVLAACFLLHPAVGWTNRENFHPDCFIALFVGMAIYGALERKWRLYWVFVVLALLVKEDVSLVVLPLGVWVAMRRDRRIGVATALAAVFATFVGMFVIMRSLIGVPTRNAWRIPFGGPGGLIRETIERPGNVIQHFRSDSRPFYFWQMTFPVAFAFLRRPGIAAISVVVLGTNMLSTFWYQYHLEYHYSLIAVPALVLGSVYALELLGQHWRRRMVALMAFTSLWACLMWGAVPIGKIIAPGLNPPLGRTENYYWPPNHPVAVAAREIMADVPADASIATYHALAPHLAHREQIFQFPNPFRVVLYGVGVDQEAARSCLPAANDLQYVLLQAKLGPEQQADWDRVSTDFDVVAANEYWVLYHRERRTVQCEPLPGQEFPQLVTVVG
jgi:uncharacterized membrane protein